MQTLQTLSAHRRPAHPVAQAWGPRAQSGGFFLGAIVGLLVGLSVALAVALYIAKVPVPFVDKVPHRTPEQQQEEAERLKSWDPNAGLGGKPVQRPAGLREPASGAVASPAPLTTVKAPPPEVPPESAASAPAPAKPASRAVAASAPAKPERDPAALLAGQGVPSDKVTAASAAKAEASFIYFVQAGAFSSADDAEQQRAKLAMAGVTARVTEREQNGRLVHRVRVGPLDSREDASAVQEKLKAVGAEAALVRVEKPVKP
ncbi:MAG: hypothetical protein C4K60_14810 [Ideonella sp. MAG2]|nr:MAG: hypothetical protein C4K60_14810 [Ideonella sp. MAG2]